MRICQSPVAVDGNQTMLPSGFVLGQEAYCLFCYTTITTSVVRRCRDEPWPHNRLAKMLYMRICVGVTLQIFVVPAKPVGNLALRMFQRYFARMANALKECPGVVASDLYSKHLIARETVEKVHFTSGLTPHDKAIILLMAVEPSIADSKSDKALKKLCGILSKHPNMKKLSNQIMKSYGKLYYGNMHQ